MPRARRADPPRVSFPGQNFYVGRPTERPDDERGRLHRHPHYEVQWVARGPAPFQCDFRQHHLPGGTFAWIAPGRAHSWGGDWQRLGLTVVGFDPQVFSSTVLHERVLSAMPFEPELETPFVTLTGAARSRVQALLDELFKHFATGAPVELLLSYLMTVMLECNQRRPTSRSVVGPAAALTARFLALVERHLLERRQVQDYATELGVNPRYLAACVRESRHTTPHALVQQRLFLEARRRLAFEDVTVEALAEALSFSDAAQFSHWFRKMGGQSPRAFRGSLDT